MMTDTLSTLSFEEAMIELETLVRKLEEGRLPLEEAIASYERGVSLKSHCESKLKAAKMRVEKIVLNQNGAPTTEAFDPDPS
jgi:exodeoxyribonuclease VII small subunit